MCDQPQTDVGFPKESGKRGGLYVKIFPWSFLK